MSRSRPITVAHLVCACCLWLAVEDCVAQPHVGAPSTSAPIDRNATIDLLRGASLVDGEARRMLGSLSETASGGGADAIKLYRSAEADGNEQAGRRLDILRQSGVSIPFSSTAGKTFPDVCEIVPTGRMDDTMAPGYHCHFLRPGQMWCHSGIN